MFIPDMVTASPNQRRPFDQQGSWDPFFVVGAPRSGSTMFRLMLNEHSLLHVPGESWFIVDLMGALPLTGALNERQVRQAHRTIVGHKMWADWRIADENLLVAFSRLQAPTLRDLVDAAFLLSADAAGKSRWGDKTPFYVKDILRLRELFPNGRFIHLIRDARDVCLSLTGLEWYGLFLFQRANHWADQVRAGIEIGRRLHQDIYLEVGYSHLVENPERELRRVCEFLNVGFEARMLQFHDGAAANLAKRDRELFHKTTRPLDAKQDGRWRREMPVRDRIIVEAMAGSIMAQVGQELQYPEAVRILRYALAPLDSVYWFSKRVLCRLGLHDEVKRLWHWRRRRRG